MLNAARSSRIFAHVVLSLLTGLRTEEARALRWTEIDLDLGSVTVLRAVRHGGDTKTLKSRRALGIPKIGLHALVEGVHVEEIAHLVGHQQTTTTEVVYRHELRPVLRTGAGIMDELFALDVAEAS